MFTLSWGDVGRGLVMAILGPVMVAIFAVLGAVINAPSFDVFAVNWSEVFHNLANVFIVASYSSGSAYLLKNFLTDSNQNFLGLPAKS